MGLMENQYADLESLTIFELANELMSQITELDSAHIACAQYVKRLRIMLNQVVNCTTPLFNTDNHLTPEQLRLNLLVREITNRIRDLDKVICQASIQASFRFKVSPKLYSQINMLSSALKQALSDLQELSNTLLIMTRD